MELTVTVSESDVLAARYVAERNAKSGQTSPVYLLRLASVKLPSDTLEGQEELW